MSAFAGFALFENEQETLAKVQRGVLYALKDLVRMNIMDRLSRHEGRGAPLKTVLTSRTGALRDSVPEGSISISRDRSTWTINLASVYARIQEEGGTVQFRNPAAALKGIFAELKKWGYYDEHYPHGRFAGNIRLPRRQFIRPSVNDALRALPEKIREQKNLFSNTRKQVIVDF